MVTVAQLKDSLVFGHAAAARELSKVKHLQDKAVTLEMMLPGETPRKFVDRLSIQKIVPGSRCKMVAIRESVSACFSSSCAFSLPYIIAT